jgi:cardiolipin synthase (CMP-forming)
MGLGIAHQLRAAIPNTLTFCRLLAVPAVGFLIYQHKLNLAFALYTAASVSDWLDGFLARRWKVQSQFGQLCDPLADKALVVVTYIMMGIKGFLPLWLVILVLARDALLLMGALLILITKKPIALAPSLISKVNTFFQMMIIGSAFLLYMAQQAGFYPGIFEFIMVGLIYATAVTTVWSGLGYALRFGEQWRHT